LILFVIWTFTLKFSSCHCQTQKAVNARNIYGMVLCSKEKARHKKIKSQAAVEISLWF